MRSGTEILKIVDSLPTGTELLITVSGPNYNNPDRTDITTLTLPLGAIGDSAKRLGEIGINIVIDGDKARFEEPLPASRFNRLSNSYDFYDDANPVIISAVKVPNDRMLKEAFYIPALFLLGLVIMLQRRRQTQPAF